MIKDTRTSKNLNAFFHLIMKNLKKWCVVMLQIKTTVTRFSYVVWLGIVQRLFNSLCYYGRASLGIKGTGPLTGGVRCHTSSRVTFLVLHEGDHVWGTWSCDILNRVVFRLRIDLWWQCTVERIVILSQNSECLACVSV